MIYRGNNHFLSSIMSRNDFLLKRFREISAALYNVQVAKIKLPPQNPFAAYRRAFALSIFGCIMLESSEFEDLSSFKNLFARLLLPFIDLEFDEISQDFCTLIF